MDSPGVINTCTVSIAKVGAFFATDQVDNARYQRLATTLRDVADSYNRDAERTNGNQTQSAGSNARIIEYTAFFIFNA
jgi:hypothetical protein